MKNKIENSSWMELEAGCPQHFKTEGKLHFDQAMIDEHRLASLSFISDYERLVYMKPLPTEGHRYLTMGLILRGNDLEEINYKVAFYNEQSECIGVFAQDVSLEVEMHFKRVCVTYPILEKACFARVGWEFKGLITGMSCFHPCVYFQ